MSIKVFGLGSTQSFAKKICEYLNIKISIHEEYCFDDGECYCAASENVRGADVFVVQSPYGDETESVNDKLMKLFVFAGALHDASVRRLTVVMPFFSYSRQDRKTNSRAPITTKYIARLLKTVWVDRILSMDAHNPTAIQNAHHIPVDLLEANNLMAIYVKENLLLAKNDLVVISPDSGGLGRTRKFRKVLSKILECDVGIACMDKIHDGKNITGNDIMGDVHGKSIIIYDDMISSGKTVLEVCEVCQKKGAKEVLAVCASHGLFVGDANCYLDIPFLRNIVITDTVKPFRLREPKVLDKLHVISTVDLFAEAIWRIHNHSSVSDLIQNHLGQVG